MKQALCLGHVTSKKHSYPKGTMSQEEDQILIYRLSRKASQPMRMDIVISKIQVALVSLVQLMRPRCCSTTAPRLVNRQLLLPLPT